MSCTDLGHGTKLLALAAAVALSGTACAPGTDAASTANPTGQAICNDTEGQVLWYFGNAPTVLDRVTSSFAKEHPDIKIQALSFGGSEGSQRFAAENDAGVSSADLLYHAVPGWADEALWKGWLQPLDESYLPALKAFPKEFRSEAEYISSVRLANIMINTDAVSDPPKVWKDLLDPQYKGKIVLTDPRNIPAWMALFNILYEDPNLGAPFLRDWYIDDRNGVSLRATSKGCTVPRQLACHGHRSAGIDRRRGRQLAARRNRRRSSASGRIYSTGYKSSGAQPARYFSSAGA
jgi:spermidine/putrescine-binding protein